MLPTRIVRALMLSSSTGPGGVPLSAASGLVQVRERLYVVADDELALGCFGLTGDAFGTRVPLFDGDLPEAAAARKAAKPDLEALARLPPFGAHPAGALIAFGSGSRANRQRGAWFALDDHGLPAGAPRHVDLAPLFEPLRARFPDLNLEGAFVDRDRLCLLQRGNGRDGVNAAVRFGLAAFTAWLEGVGPAPAATSIATFELGRIDGVALAFTDGAALPGGGWVFSAAAEDTHDPYLDGRCAGSVVGVVDATGTLRRTERLAGTPKVEGIAASAEGTALRLWMVTDADDRQSPALLLHATLDPSP